MIVQWYRSLPRFTRFWFTTTVVMSCIAARFEFLPIQWLSLETYWVFVMGEWWRCITSLFAYPIDSSTAWHFMVNCYFIVQYSGKLEKGEFGRSPSDYLYLLIIASVLANIGGFLFGFSYLMDMPVMMVTYVWCQLYKDVTVSFWFGSRFKALYLPWVLALFEFIFIHSFASLVGIFNGHVYYFLKYEYPRELGGKHLLNTPRFLKRLIPDVYGGRSGVFGAPPEGSYNYTPQDHSDRSWGQGITLGRN
ncbi:hypothetical protein KR009_001388 [Drosophila setifemur]|nr:hypothetical protein KR009_001388 [Drosophila setifemur]